MVFSIEIRARARGYTCYQTPSIKRWQQLSSFFIIMKKNVKEKILKNSAPNYFASCFIFARHFTVSSKTKCTLYSKLVIKNAQKNSMRICLKNKKLCVFIEKTGYFSIYWQERISKIDLWKNIKKYCLYNWNFRIKISIFVYETNGQRADAISIVHWNIKCVSTNLVYFV